MNSKNQAIDRHIIWGDIDLNLDDWRENLQEDYPELSETELYQKMYDINGEYLDDERANLNIQLSQPIIPAISRTVYIPIPTLQNGMSINTEIYELMQFITMGLIIIFIVYLRMECLILRLKTYKTNYPSAQQQRRILRG